MNNFFAKRTNLRPAVHGLTLSLLTITLAQHHVQAAAGTISAADFGFSSSNSGSDNALDLQKALDSGSKVVSIPPGSYDIGPAMVTVPSGVTLTGAPGAHLNAVSGSGCVLDMLSKSTVTGITFNGAAGKVAYADGTYGTKLDGVISAGSNSNTGVSGVTIANCTIDNSTLDGIYIERVGSAPSAAPTVIEGCTIDSVFQGIETAYSSNIHVFYNTVHNTKSAGMIFWGNVREGSNWVARNGRNIDCEYNSVTDAGGNVVNAPGGAGIWSSGCQNITFSHNRVDGAQDGDLDMEWCSQGQMTDNTLSRSAYGGVAMFFSSEDIVIANNHITNNRKSGSNGAVNAGVFFAWPGKDQFRGDVGYKNVLIYNNFIDSTANGAWKQRTAWIDCDTSLNVQYFGNRTAGDTPTYLGGSNPSVVAGTDNLTLNNLAQTPLSDCLPEIGDGSFELPIVAPGTSAQAPQDAIEQYCTFSGTAGIASNGSNLGNPDAPDGTQVGYVQGQGSIGQTAWFPAGSWNVAFCAAGDGKGKQESIRVLVDGHVLSDFTPAKGFVYYVSRPISLSEGNHVIVFKGLKGKSEGAHVFIDSVNFTPA